MRDDLLKSPLNRSAGPRFYVKYKQRTEKETHFTLQTVYGDIVFLFWEARKFVCFSLFSTNSRNLELQELQKDPNSHHSS